MHKHYVLQCAFKSLDVFFPRNQPWNPMPLSEVWKIVLLTGPLDKPPGIYS